MSNNYKIHRWDPMISGNNTIPNPMIYIKPDDTLLKFAKENNNAVLVVIKGTNTIYDGKRIIGMFASSKDYPNCRPVFFNDTKYYVISLLCDWYEYPKDPTFLGNCEIYGLKGGVDVDEIKNSVIKDPKFHTVEKDTVEKYDHIYTNNKECGMKFKPLVMTSVGITIILLTILILTKK
mgnify:CR=1 FL=1